MKILIIQEAGRNEPNKEFREAKNFHRSFQKLGIDSVVWGLNYENFNIPYSEISKDCDVIFLLENYETGGWVPDLSKEKKLKLFWSIDSHCVPTVHFNTVKNHNIDIVLYAVYNHGKLFGNRKTIYLPNAYPDDLIYPIDGIEKTNDVGFCGSILNRQSYLNLLSNNFNFKNDIFVLGNKMVETINSYKIHFNRNLSDDINFRTFETLGCKTFLITNQTPGLEELFEIDKHLVVYKNNDELIEKIKFYLENENERALIENQGYDFVKSNHTYFQRAKQIVKIIKEHV